MPISEEDRLYVPLLHGGGQVQTTSRQLAGAYKLKVLSCRKLRKNSLLPLTRVLQKPLKRSRRGKKVRKLKAARRVERVLRLKQLYTSVSGETGVGRRQLRRRARVTKSKLWTLRGVRESNNLHTVNNPGSSRHNLGYFTANSAQTPLESNQTTLSMLLLTSLDRGAVGFRNFDASCCVDDFVHRSKTTTPAYLIYTVNLVHWWLSFDRYPLPTLATFITPVWANRSVTLRHQFFNYSRTSLISLRLTNLQVQTKDAKRGYKLVKYEFAPVIL